MSGLTELLFPRKCPFCEKLLRKEETELCGECRTTLPWTGADCRTHGSFFSRCVSPLRYRGHARSAVLRFKFHRKQTYAECFGKLMAACVREQPGEYDVIAYVPVSYRRYRRRGYCQSRLLAETLSRELGLPCEKLLKKCRHTEAQSHLQGEAARRANVSGAFCMAKGADAAGKRILLADDVVTTGATLSECSRVLLTAGAEQVGCVTLCRADRQK